MNEGARHVIRRQTLELAVTSDSRAQAIQDEAHRICTERLIPIMDGVFDSLDSPDAVFRVERLELDLDPVSSSNLEEDLVEQLRRHLPNALEKELKRLLEAPVRQRAGALSQAATRLQVLETFLRTGTLPWWTASVGSFDLELVFEKAIEESSIQVEALLRRIMTRRIARRLAKQLAPRAQSRLVEVLAPAEAAQFERTALAWQELLLDHPEKTQGLDEVFVQEETLYFLALTDRAVATTRTLSEHLLWRFVETQNLDVGTSARRLLARTDPEEPTQASLRAWLLEVVETKADGEDHRPPRLAAAAERADLGLSQEALQASDEEERGADQATGSDRSAAEGSSQEPTQEGRRHEVREDEGGNAAELRRVTEADGVAEAGVPDGLPVPVEMPPSEGAQLGEMSLQEDHHGQAEIEEADFQYLDNAGLVIVWPFLVRFFRGIELVDGDSFRSLEAQERAVLLLQHLVTGEFEWPEHELFLNKLLCGWPPEEPVGKKIQLTELESSEAEDLLESMIQHWKVLKKTSVDGFRASFLQREGRLSLQKNGWSLRVARASYDVLLDQLPWGISFVLLPWMKAPIFVEW